MTFIPQNFVDQQTVIDSAWLNGVDVTVNSVLAGAQTVLAAQQALSITPLTQASIGEAFYPEIPAEATVTLVNQAYPALNVLRYGTNTAPGTTDMTAAFQSALTVAAVSGGKIKVPAGIYKITSQLTVTGTYVYIEGDGAGATIIKAYGITGNLFAFGGASLVYYQGISNLKIDCSNAASCTAVYVQNVVNFYYANIDSLQPYVGIDIVGGVIQFYSNFTMAGIGYSGIQLNGGNDRYFVNGVLSNVGYSQATQGINVQSSGGDFFVSIDAIECGNGFLVNPGAGQSVEFLSVMNCDFDTCSNDCINIQPTSTGTVFGLTFTGCWSSTATNYGVYIGAAGTSNINGVSFVNHRSFNNGASGYVVTTPAVGASCANIRFTECQAAGNSRTTPWLYSGFDIGAGVNDFSIVDCMSGAYAAYANTQLRGIIVDAGSSNAYIITGNQLTGNGPNAWVNSTAYVTGNQVTYNAIAYTCITGNTNSAPPNGNWTTGTNVALTDLGTGTTKVINSNLGFNPLPQTAVTVTASPFGFVNETGAPVILQVTGGTVSQIAVGNATWSSTNQSIVVPHNLAAIITYSSAPTVVYYGI